MNFNTRQKVRHSPSRGSVLIIALVLLLAVALSTMYLSLVLINEIKATRAADEGINASFVAESAVERGLWRLQQGEGMSSGGTNFFADALSDKKNLCAGDDGGAADQCVSRCSNDANTICNYPATDCPVGGSPYCTTAMANGDRELLYDHKTVSEKSFTYTKYNIPYGSSVYTKVYNANIRGGVGQHTGVTQLNVYWYVDACTATEQNSVLRVYYQPIDITSANNDCNSVTALTQYCQTLLTPVAPGFVDITCGCNSTSNDVDENGVSMYRCGANFWVFPSGNAVLDSSKIPDTNYYRIKFTPMTSGVTVRKIKMNACAQGNSCYMPSQVEIDSFGSFRGSRSELDYHTEWMDAYASSTSLFSHEDIQHVQTVSGFSKRTINTGALSLPVTITNNKAGNLLMVAIDWEANSSGPSSNNFGTISDSAGNTYTQIGSELSMAKAGYGLKSRLYYAKNINASASNTITITVSGSDGDIPLDGYVTEYSGASPTIPLDGTPVYSSNSGTNGAGSQPFTSNTISISRNLDMLYGFEADSACGTAGAGWTSRSTFDCNVVADKYLAPQGSNAFTGTAGGTTYMSWIVGLRQ